MKQMKWFILLLTICIVCSLSVSGCGGGGTTAVNPPVVPTEITPAPVVTEIPTAPPQPVTSVTGYVFSKIDGEASLNDVILIVSNAQPSINNYSPVVSAKVYLATNSSIETTTDGTGRFTLNNVPYSQGDMITKIIVETNELQAKGDINSKQVFSIPTGTNGNANKYATIPTSYMPISPGDNRQLQGYGVNEQNQVVRSNLGTWSSTIGQIGSNTGTFEAPTSAGSGTITYTDQGVSVEINVEVVSNNSLGSITGTVTYSNGSPASGVIVSVDGLTVASKTDTNGQYSITNVPAGQNTLIASYNGVNSGTTIATVVSGQNNVVNIKLNIGQNSPVITSIYPASASIGSSITISGSKFGSTGNVTFNGVSAQIISWTGTSIAVVVPTIQPGTASVIVTSGSQNSNGLSINIVDNPTPTPANTFTPTPANTFTPTPAGITPTYTPTAKPASNWSVNVKVNDSESPGAENPYITVDSSGNAYAIWEDYRNGNTGIYFSYRSSEGSWNTNVRVDDTPSGSSAENPCIAIDGSGNAYAVWEDNRAGKHIIRRAYRPSGGNWGSSEIVDNPILSSTTGEYNPRITYYSARGIFYILWEHNGNGNSDIYYSWKQTGSWTGSGRVDDASGSTFAGYPSAVGSVSGSFYCLATWVDGRNGNNDIYYSSRSSSNWASNQKVNTSAGGLGGPRIAVDPYNGTNIHIVWQDNQTSQVYYGYSASGGAWSNQVIASGYSPDIAIAPAPRYLAMVIWNDGQGNMYFSSRYLLGGGSWSNPERVDDRTGGTWAESPHIVTDSSGKAYAIWCDSRNGHKDIYFSIRQ